MIRQLSTLLWVATFILSGCGESQPQTNFTGTSTNNGTTASWNPPPVAATCTAGDADKDGSCDDVDPTPGNSDGDGDGQVDGMDLTPKGKGSSHSSDSGLSPLAWGLIGAGTYLVGSWAYNSLLSDCEIEGAKTYCVVRANWEDDKNYMTITENEQGAGKLTVHLDNVEINDAYWFALGSGLLMGNMQCKADMKFSHALRAVDAIPPAGAISAGASELEGYSPFYWYAPIGSGNSPVAATTAIQTQVTPNGGCDGDGVTIRCGANTFCMEGTEFGSENMPFQANGEEGLVTTQVAFDNFIGNNTNGAKYDPEHYMTLYQPDGLLKIPQGWFRDTSAGFSYDKTAAIKGKWKPQMQ